MRELTLSQRLSRLDVKASPYLYISPFFILFFIVGLFPLVYTAYVSVHDWHLLRGHAELVVGIQMSFDGVLICGAGEDPAGNFAAELFAHPSVAAHEIFKSGPSPQFWIQTRDILKGLK